MDEGTGASGAEVIVELDERRRASFGRSGRPEHRRYLVTEESDGTIVMRPAVVMTELEARMLANPKLVRRIEANRRDPSRLVRRPRRG
jgi:hypothetical protein